MLRVCVCVCVRERERDTDRQTDRDRATEKDRDRQNPISKTLFYKDCSLGLVKSLTTRG